MKSTLKVIVLKNCPYSIAAVELLTNNKIPFKKIVVTQETKYKYKTKEISTFPQIYILNKSEQILLGGYSDIEEIVNIINQSKNLDKIKKKLNIKYSKNVDKKIILRIIELFAPYLI
jgi:glutaredoxin